MFSKMFSPLVLILMVSSVLGHSIDHSIAQQYQTLQDCLISKGVPTTLNSSSDWISLTTAYNLRLQYTPVAVIIPTTPQHVSDSITCAATSGIKVQPRSGGHSYGSYSLGGKNGSLVIDLQKFNEISLDKCESHITPPRLQHHTDLYKATNIAKVGSGVRLGNLGLAVFAQGHAALPHGTFPGVGIGGHYTHGGFGYSSRKWGE
jgi:FAD/FMN-containing dehydrogenase